MKQNTFDIIIGIIGLLEVLLFWASIQLSNPFIIAVGFIVGAGLYFVLRRKITDCSADERQNMIDMKTASATLKAFWVSFFTVNLATVVYVFSAPLGFQNITYSVVARRVTNVGAEVMNAPGKLAHNVIVSKPPTDAYSVAITLHQNATDAV